MQDDVDDSSFDFLHNWSLSRSTRRLDDESNAPFFLGTALLLCLTAFLFGFFQNQTRTGSCCCCGGLGTTWRCSAEGAGGGRAIAGGRFWSGVWSLGSPGCVSQLKGTWPGRRQAARRAERPKEEFLERILLTKISFSWSKEMGFSDRRRRRWSIFAMADCELWIVIENFWK